MQGKRIGVLRSFFGGVLVAQIAAASAAGTAGRKSQLENLEMSERTGIILLSFSLFSHAHSS